ERIGFLFPHILTRPLQRVLRVTKGEACLNSSAIVPVVCAVCRFPGLNALKNFTRKRGREREPRRSERDAIPDTSVRNRHDVDAVPRVGFGFKLVRSVVGRRGLVEPFLVATHCGSYSIHV